LPVAAGVHAAALGRPSGWLVPERGRGQPTNALTALIWDEFGRQSPSERADDRRPARGGAAVG
jgi:hypothetical protein